MLSILLRWTHVHATLHGRCGLPAHSSSARYVSRVCKLSKLSRCCANNANVLRFQPSPRAAAGRPLLLLFANTIHGTTSMTRQATSTTTGAQTAAATSESSFVSSKLAPNVTLPWLNQHLSVFPTSHMLSNHRIANQTFRCFEQTQPCVHLIKPQLLGCTFKRAIVLENACIESIHRPVP